jgi:Spy/CpxP family protein refolding chaperone
MGISPLTTQGEHMKKFQALLVAALLVGGIAAQAQDAAPAEGAAAPAKKHAGKHAKHGKMKKDEGKMEAPAAPAAPAAPEAAPAK